MTVPAFDKVLVPLEFVPANRDDPSAVEVGGHVIALPPSLGTCLELGARLAGHGTLRLVHATPSLADAALYGGPEGTWIPDASLRELDDRAHRAALKVLADLARKFMPNTNVELRAAAGRPMDIILREAQEFQADVIVLATSGRGRARRFFLGSTADKIIREANCPVLVVPSHEG